MDIVEQLRAFVGTAQTGSFTAAAERMGVSNRLTSKYVAELEARLGTRLLQRTTRRVGLTPAGEKLLARAPAWLEELEELLGSVEDEARGFSGVLRVSAPLTFGEIYAADLLNRFAAPHPELSVELRLSDAYTDLALEGIDLAFRIGQLTDNTLKARRLCRIGMKLVASPGYVAARGAPGSPAALSAHACIHDSNQRSPRWRFGAAGAPQEVRIDSRFAVNSARVARDMALAGRGIAYCPEFVVTADIEAGRLVEVLAEEEKPAHDLHAVYLEGAILPRKVRALVDFAAEDVKTHLLAG